MRIKRKILLIGASENPERYSNKAMRLLSNDKYELIAIGNKIGQVGDIKIGTERISIQDVDTITLYLNASRQQEYYKYLIGLKPKRIIFNPGAENPELKELAQKEGIETLEACTLVLLHTGQF